MKKSLLFICFIFLFNITAVFAEGSYNQKTTVEFDIHIGNIENFKVCNAEMALYNTNNERLGVLNVEIDAVDVTKSIPFVVDEYTAGEEFYIMFLNNVDCIKYQSEFYGIYSKIPVKTYCDYYDENSQLIKGNKFSMTIYPLEQQKISFSHNSRTYKTDHPIKMVDGNCMISLVDVMNIFDLWQDKTSFDDVTGKLVIFNEDKNVEMTLWSNDASNGEAVTLATPPIRINSLMYVPLRFVCESLGARVNALNENGVLMVNVITSDGNFPEKDAFINSTNLTSRTNYLIWIDKSDFRVTVFEGSKNNWRAINSYPCSIGAPGTPTVTGVFEYYSKEKRWSYPGYYCGPIMRFYGGYAMHSTLVRYDGTDYDPRLEMMISHGCIRMKPSDIQYLWDTIPLYTRIYVTEYRELQMQFSFLYLNIF